MFQSMKRVKKTAAIKSDKHEQVSSRILAWISALILILLSSKIILTIAWKYYTTARNLEGVDCTADKKLLSSSATEHALQSFVRDNNMHSPSMNIASNKPTFILHVGLPKTGTTFLQCSLCTDFNLTEPTLRNDNFIYLGTCPYPDCGIETPPQYLYHWMGSFFEDDITEPQANELGPIPHDRLVKNTTSTERMPRLVEDFLVKVRRAKKLKLNAMVIFEGCHQFSDRNIYALARYLNPYWNVKILVAHRPLYEWLPSKYNSINKPSRNPAGRVWPGLHHPDHPHTMGAPIPPFDLDHRGEFTELIQDIEKYHQHPAETTRDNYKRYFDDVQVIPLNQLPKDGTGDAMLTHLFCHNVLGVPTPNTCQAVRNRQVMANASNPSDPLNYDALAVAAYQTGLLKVHKQLRRKDVARKIGKYQEGELHLSSHDFPQECLPQATMDRLERLSLDLERQLFASTWTEDLEREHKAGFLKNRNKFCWVDTNKTLQDARWKSFFNKLNKDWQDQPCNQDELVECSDEHYEPNGESLSADSEEDGSDDLPREDVLVDTENDGNLSVKEQPNNTLEGDQIAAHNNEEDSNDASDDADNTDPYTSEDADSDAEADETDETTSDEEEERPADSEDDSRSEGLKLPDQDDLQQIMTNDIVAQEGLLIKKLLDQKE